MSAERLADAVRAQLRREIAAAGGREVSFAAQVDGNGMIVAARVLARGTPESVLALPGAVMRGAAAADFTHRPILESTRRVRRVACLRGAPICLVSWRLA